MTTTTTQARCAACGLTGPVPAIAECGACGSSQIRKVEPIDEALRDALAHAENLLAVNETERKRIQALIARLVFALEDAP